MRSSTVLLLVLVLVGLTGCSSAGDSASTTLDVSAAASLKSTFTAIAAEFEREHDGVDVRLSLDGSSTLANQITQGAPADVFASADEKSMDKLAGLAVAPRIFARNTLVIVTAPGNPRDISSIADLNRPDVTSVVCQSAQPCGSATEQIERTTGITIDATSEEHSVTAVLTKVTTGQADAGVVYVTDARAAGDRVDTVSDPAFAAVVNDYPIAVVRDSEVDALARQFVDFVLGPRGRTILAGAGFEVP